ncbi:putative Tic20 family protein [Agrococcus sp. UYP33]
MTDPHSQPPARMPDEARPRFAPQGFQPQQGFASQSQQGFASQHGYAGGPLAPLPTTGVRHWAWQLLCWVPIPLVPLLVVPAVLLGLRGGAVRNGGVDEANSRAALNWSLTWMTAVVVTVVLHVVLLFALTSGGSISGSSPQGVVLAITGSLLGIAYIGGAIMTLINVIRGWVAAARGEAARPLLAVRFWRAP